MGRAWPLRKRRLPRSKRRMRQSVPKPGQLEYRKAHQKLIDDFTRERREAERKIARLQLETDALKRELEPIKRKDARRRRLERHGLLWSWWHR